MEVCRKCGAVLRETDKFCSQCGAKIPSAGAKARQARAQKKKQQKEITFRTKPEKGTHYRENFEEGENRSRALRLTVTILALMMLAVAGFAVYYLHFGRRPSVENSTAGGGSAAIEILTEAQAVSEAAAPGDAPGEEEPPKEDAAAAQEQKQTEAQTQK